jgi:SlyX protein
MADSTDSNIELLKRQLTEVQTQLAFQEDTVAELSDALGLQQREIMVLRRQLELLKQRQDEQPHGQEPGASQEKPPHY